MILENDTDPGGTGARTGVSRAGGASPYRWFIASAAVAAPFVALASWYRAPGPHSTLQSVCYVLAVVPFLLVALVPRIPTLTLVSTAVPVGVIALTGPVDPIIGTLPAIGLLLAVAQLPQGLAIAAGACTIAVTLVAAALGGGLLWVATAFGFTAAWIAGRGLGMLLDALEELRLSGRREAEQAARVERRRLAREIHDLVAHALTGTTLSLAEVRLQLDRDHDAARAALDQAESLARASLADLRRTVRLLSEEGDPLLTPPIELESDLGELLDNYRRAGVDVSYEQVGTPVVLSVTGAWAAYRVVQESLTNAARHAPGAPVHIATEWSGDGVTVKVRNDVSPAGTAPVTDIADGRRRGEGIKGMSERVRLLGGRFAAGPTSTGWVVNAWIPDLPNDMAGAL